MWQHVWQDEQLKQMADIASVGLVIGALTEYLPAIAAVVSIIWGLIRIAETETVQRALGKYRWISKKEHNDE